MRKSIIISNKQFQYINEGIVNDNIPTFTVNLDGDMQDASQMAQKAKETFINAGVGEDEPARVQLVGDKVDNANNVPLEGAGADELEQATDIANSSAQLDQKNIIGVIGNRAASEMTTAEGRVFTKKMLEERRLNAIMRNTQTFTKKDFDKYLNL